MSIYQLAEFSFINYYNNETFIADTIQRRPLLSIRVYIAMLFVIYYLLHFINRYRYFLRAIEKRKSR